MWEGVRTFRRCHSPQRDIKDVKEGVSVDGEV